jgi:hypothetical protein
MENRENRENKKKRNSVENYIYSQNYESASQSENPDEKCNDCTALFIFKNKTRCYVYEQQRFKDMNVEFNPQRDHNCNLFENEHSFDNEIDAYQKALAKEIDPQNDREYQKVLKEENDNFDMLQNFGKNNYEEDDNNYEEDDEEDWNDPSTYAHCGDWEDEPENCYHCADDECLMNKS